MIGLCFFCHTVTEVYRRIQAATGKSEMRCSACLNQPHEFKRKETAAHEK